MLKLDDKRYKECQWINIDPEHRPQYDSRPESYHVKDIDSLQLLESIDGKKPNWGSLSISIPDRRWQGSYNND